MKTEAAALDPCAAEPIRIPGSIQSHGVLLVLDRALMIRQTSDSATTFLPRGAEELLGQSGELVLGSRLYAELRYLVDAAVLKSGPSYLGRVVGRDGDLDAIAHQAHDSVMLELERAPAERAGLFQVGYIHNTVQSLIDALPFTQNAFEICEIAVDRLCALTGFGRVMAYRFDRNDHGEVLSERARDGFDWFGHQWYTRADLGFCWRGCALDLGLRQEALAWQRSKRRRYPQARRCKHLEHAQCRTSWTG